MKRLRDPNWFLIVVFLGILLAVPLVQTVTEVGADDGVVALEIFSAQPTAENLRAYEKKLEQNSWAARVSRPLVQFANFAWLKYGGEKAVIGAHGWYFFKPGLNYMLARPNTHTNATNDPVSAIVDFRDQLAARGIHLLVMPIPNKESIYPDQVTARVKNRGEQMAPRTREVIEKLRAANVEVIDVFKEFSAARKLSSVYTQFYLAQDTHWSPKGVEIVAQAVAHRLNELGWIRPGAAEYADKLAGVQRHGDILRMLQTPAIERAVAPEYVPAVQIVRTDNSQLYKDDPNSEIVVIGDSFMRIYQEDQPTAAGFIAHLAKELKQPILSLVNDGGGSTLVREELCARPPFLLHKKVVVWEFVERDIGIGIKGWRRTPLPPFTTEANQPSPVEDRSRSAAR